MSPKTAREPKPELRGLEKTPTGIKGFDEVTFGGLPRGRPTLVAGGAGCGKTLFGMHFLVRGATDYDEPGVFIAFEEREQDLVQNVASLGFDLDDLVERKLLALDHVHVDATQIEEAGEYDLEGLFLRLDGAISSIGAKRVVIDTLETLFGGLSNHAILRAELVRLFHWLKERGVTTIVTAERGSGTLTRHGLEEYVSDCVVVLDHRVHDQVSTRRVRVVKYRGSTHGTNEYPFLIDETGLTVVPITSAGLSHSVSDERVSSGIPTLDAMLGGGGYFRGSSILVSGPAGTGKSSLGAHFAAATCARGERCLYVSYEESPAQIERNMRSVGLNLRPFVEQKLLDIVGLRATMHGLEGHLALSHKMIDEIRPSTVVLDPIGSLVGAGDGQDAHLMVMRLVDLLKTRGITGLLTNLTHGGEHMEATSVAVSSLVDTWLLVRNLETNGERNRALYVLKSRGTAHSNQVREFVMTSAGIELVEPYIGPEGVLTGTARIAQENRDRAASETRTAEAERLAILLERKRAALERQIASLQAEFAADEAEMRRAAAVGASIETAFASDRKKMADLRGAAATNGGASHEETERQAPPRSTRSRSA
jgi:circadian clock protein KaiC